MDVCERFRWTIKTGPANPIQEPCFHFETASALFAFFLIEELGVGAVTPKLIRECYEVALLPPPGNISDAMAKSMVFVKTKSGLQLKRSAREQIKKILARPEEAEPDANPATVITARVETGLRAKNVMVVHGRNHQIRDSMFDFLRALKLNPIEWSEATKATGKGSPYVGEILDAAFKMAQAVVVLFTPDERVTLDRDRCSGETEFEREQGRQARPNVFLEGGMALGRDEGHTVLVEVGDNRPATDLLGRHTIRMDDGAEKRNELAQRLRTAGCDVDTGGQDWYRSGKFKVHAKRRQD
jgi:predicted nucleotide-binding protein